MEAADDNPKTATSILHGDLDLRIIEARRLPNMDLVSDRLRRCFTVFDSCRDPCSKEREEQQHRRHKIITSDPYVMVGVSGARVARTRVISNNQNPIWNEHFKIPLAHPAEKIEFYVKDDDMFGAEFIGIASVEVEKILSGERIKDWFPIIGLYGKPPKTGCALHIEMKFTKCEQIDNKLGVENCYFPVRHGGNVTLYQDAHVPDSSLPEIELENGNSFRHEKCWEDICHAIVEAHHLVYIVGWSIYHKVRLVREPSKPLPRGGDLNLGELLKYKSQEGVRVLLLVWDDKTSHNKFFIRTVVGTLYTHHQKCVIVDAQASVNNRKITAFIGGLDLCDGRYDTPEHRLFQDLDTVFQDDYHNPTFPAGTMGPRQPWHDLHCKIEGPAAYDVLTNFEQRWRKASKWSEFGRSFKRSTPWRDDSLIKLERISWINGPSPSVLSDDPKLWVSKEDDPENWHVQVFRSIDSGSLKGFPKDVYRAEKQNLVCAKNMVIDKSIQTAYVQAIRLAQHFIYIENQYFLGSSFAWSEYKNAGAENLIPMELALKIASKIRAKERFAVYVVIPMWPEGAPTSASVQEILFWQGQTMQMMYEVIAKELKSMNLENSHPQDYLNFYCLGNREQVPGSDKSGDQTVSMSQKFQRFMVYVHAKGMIVDDEYIILGSANINERSMAGSRDTEIAMGAYQPHHTWSKKKRHPLGQVYGYRMSLWAEHLGLVDNLFKEPGSLDCVKSVNKIAEDNWKKFTAEDFTLLQGHLLKYPVEVDANGKVSPLPGQETFPDVGGKVLGARTNLPDALTT
ncbi:phospholipase D delta-like [Populus alba x Populus x berolinensis]|uniref:Phospholipase D n=1 Tax=Populus alba x Populus x berolinensis TaxID=444605 RepID=A0AAD6QY97_9ROSI|nr:phospholipase D delta-like [Populus alba x Populus x berolinensis]